MTEDRASRSKKAESITEFCRGVLFKRAREILDEKARSQYPPGKVRALKVADTPKKDGE